MGGRGSAFKITSGFSNINFDIGYDEETYTKLPTEHTDYLKNNKHTWTMNSTDKFNRDLMNSQTKFLSNITKEYKSSSNFLSNENNLRIRAMNFKREGVFAAFVSPANGKYEKLQIVYNTQAMNKSIEQIKQEETRYQNIGEFAHSDKDKLINKTLAHEYGHFIEKTLIEKHLKEYPNEREKASNYVEFQKYYSKQSRKIYDEIYKIKCEQFNDYSRKRVSKYAEETFAENFAEIFCNLTTSKRPTNWAKAMKIYLKEKGICE